MQRPGSGQAEGQRDILEAYLSTLFLDCLKSGNFHYDLSGWRQTIDTRAEMYISVSGGARASAGRYLHIMREVSAFARSNGQGIPEPQAVGRAT